ncbi:HCL514Cp [Eremothecium sinecaudum]|uniref:Prephenate dehydrogenase [NADP(+)] n=1 Tax=Eremothecium sinecaudum TaxID=45286 RepID=A0A120K1R0_9SACH|nr:HCL514Cp [Eremothecium sinecaudum]AMD19637.1 HCL514Cp [Eremothecium sinecaudum]
MTAIEENAQVKHWMDTKIIGIIGLGDMGLMYAEKLSQAGWNVICCDRPERYEELREKHKGASFRVFANGHLVARMSDYLMYSVEAANIGKIVARYGSSTKVGAVVGGQTSCKREEIKAFEEQLPDDLDIVTVHSLHGPRVSSEGQPLVIIAHRTSRPDSLPFVESVLSCLKSKHVYLTAEEHDRITADTQAVTHAAFLSMGLAWYRRKLYPWQVGPCKWYGGLENVKVNISLRIYSNKWHVYAGLAITNDAARQQIMQYAESSKALFSLFLEGNEQALKERLQKAKDFIFSKHEGPLMLQDVMLEKHTIAKYDKTDDVDVLPNSHLSLLAIADSWYHLGINPYDHMICSTPLFRIFLGVTEYLFLKPGLLEKTIDATFSDKSFRADDLEFVGAVGTWSQLVTFGDYDLYRQQFEEVQQFFQPMFEEATKIGNEMISVIQSKL